VQTSTKKRLSATVTYLLVALAVASLCLAASAWTLPQWQTAEFFSPTSLALLHGILLGFMLTVAYGVLYQVVPIAFQAPPMPRHLLYWQLPEHLVAVALLVAGMLCHRWSWTVLGGICVLGGLLAFAHFLYHKSYKRARNRTPVHRMLALPLVALGLTMLVGLWQALWPSNVDRHLLLVHLLLGGYLFWGGLVLVISYKFVPMFALSHGYRASLPRAGGCYFIAGLILVGVEWVRHLWPNSQVEPLRWMDAGAVMLGVLGIFLFSVDVRNILRARKRNRLVFPLQVALTALAVTLLSACGLLVALIAPRVQLVTISAYLFLFAGLMPMIFAYMQKIIPFLWFEYRFSKRPERRSAPLIDDMVPPRRVRMAMATYGLGVIAGCVCLVPWPATHLVTRSLATISAGLTTVGALLLLSALCHVLTIGGPRPADTPEW
jgi:hypothetical protein